MRLCSKQRLVLSIALGAFFALVSATTCSAQHAYDVEKLSASGKHYEALLAFEKLARRSMPATALVAAGKSAWAMGLPDDAMARFNSALDEGKLNSVERARVNFMKGIIAFQEGRHQDAILFGSRAHDLVATAGPLRATINILLGQAREALNEPGKAEKHFRAALDEGDPRNEAEALYHLGKNLLKLNRATEAEPLLERIPAGDDRSPEALRMLAEIALERRDFQRTEFWLTHGRTHYPDLFVDSWVDYALLEAAIHEGSREKVRAIRAAASARYAPSDPWYTLIDAKAEIYEWQAAREGLS